MDLTVIILTANERLHIARCLERLAPLEPAQVFVIDCLSTDGTQEIARKSGLELGAWSSGLGAEGSRPSFSAVTVVEHAWPGNQAVQFNWALDNCPIRTRWVLRLDADEYLTPDAIEELKGLLPTLPEDVAGIELPLIRIWQGHVMKHGVGQIVMLRFFRFGKGRYGKRLMDEHIRLSEGRIVSMKHGFADDNLNSFKWWQNKHRGYAVREALELLAIEYKPRMNADTDSLTLAEEGLNAQAAAKRRMKERYARLPLYWRAFAYFLYRYFLKKGFLDGWAGLTWNFWQGWWYRNLVDCTVAKIKRETNVKHHPEEAWTRIEKYAKEKYGIVY